MEKQEAVMSVAPENGGEGTAAGPRPELCSPRSRLSPIPTPERRGQPRRAPLRWTPAGHTRTDVPGVGPASC